AIFNLHRINQVYIHFLGHLLDGQFGVGEESLESRLFHEKEIPWPEMAFESSIFTLRTYFADRQAGVLKVHLSKYPL
ncbi:MAG: NUDIX hydrolase, partial [Phaeodactylibacter sp.]|nr:NUDIX hydrolase [Phaeodactylibacter sp.]